MHKATKPTLPTTPWGGSFVQFCSIPAFHMRVSVASWRISCINNEQAPPTTSGMRRNVSHLWTVLGLGTNRFQTSDVLACPRQGVAHHGACPCPPEWMCLACVALSQWMCPAMWLAGLAHHVASSLCLVLMLQLLSQTVQTCVFCCKHPQRPNMRMYIIICMSGQ